MSQIIKKVAQIIKFIIIIYVVYQLAVTIVIFDTYSITSQSSIETVRYGKEEAINQVRKFTRIVLFLAFITIVWKLINKKNKKGESLLGRYMKSLNKNKPLEENIEDIIQEEEKKYKLNKILNKIKTNNTNFNHVDFIYGSTHLCKKILYSNDKDELKKIRVFETSKLFKEQLLQIKNNKKNNIKAIKEDIKIKSAKILKYEATDKIDVIRVKITAEMKEYEINEKTNDLIRGDKKKIVLKSYIMTFAKKIEKHIKKATDLNTKINCPSCGAPIQIDVIGKCIYCGNYVRTEKFNWKVVDIKEE